MIVNRYNNHPILSTFYWTALKPFINRKGRKLVLSDLQLGTLRHRFSHMEGDSNAYIAPCSRGGATSFLLSLVPVTCSSQNNEPPRWSLSMLPSKTKGLSRLMKLKGRGMQDDVELWAGEEGRGGLMPSYELLGGTGRWRLHFRSSRGDGRARGWSNTRRIHKPRRAGGLPLWGPREQGCRLCPRAPERSSLPHLGFCPGKLILDFWPPGLSWKTSVLCEATKLGEDVCTSQRKLIWCPDGLSQRRFLFCTGEPGEE